MSDNKNKDLVDRLANLKEDNEQTIEFCTKRYDEAVKKQQQKIKMREKKRQTFRLIQGGKSKQAI